MSFVVKTANDRHFGPFDHAGEAVDWAHKYLPASTQWVIVPVYSLTSATTV